LVSLENEPFALRYRNTNGLSRKEAPGGFEPPMSDLQSWRMVFMDHEKAGNALFYSVWEK